jgi:hypothetical protein
MSKDEILKEKFMYLRKLEALDKSGIDISKKYNMDSNLLEMKAEYDLIMDEKYKKTAIKLQANIMMTIVNGIEYLNNKFDPFDVKLEGWGDQVNENINDYDDIFSELHEKYKNSVSVSPELRLLFQLGGSAFLVHLSNTVFKANLPSVDDIFRQNPELMRQFQSAAVNSMSSSNPGFSGFMNGIINNDPHLSQQQHQRQGPPPPMATQQQHHHQQNYTNTSTSHFDDGISIKESNQWINGNGNGINGNGINGNGINGNGINGNNNNELPHKSLRIKRPDMKGPSQHLESNDISQILSGLKTKTIEIPQEDINNSSTISVDELNSMQDEGNVPKRTKRKPKSDKNKNTVSLDI